MGSMDGEETRGSVRINLGGGRLRIEGYVNIDITQFVDGNGNECVDIVRDVECTPLPYEDGSVDEIFADNFFEHITELKYVLNECHRVLKEDGILRGGVPMAGTDADYRDPTHCRHFIYATFEYFVGSNPANPNRPLHPKYADYGFLPWEKVQLYREGDIIRFMLQPRKVEV